MAYVATLRTLKEQIAALDAQIREQLPAHPDHDLFTSLSRSGTVRAARLLAEIGDCRARFPTPESLSCLAGVAPSTRASGKSRHVGFRWSLDKHLRDAITRGHDHAHATRTLARAWLFVIWHCWQNDTAYDPDQHRALQRVLAAQHKIHTEGA